jgi:protein ImuA
MVMVRADKAQMVSSLQTDILRLQGFKPANSPSVDLGLGPIRHAFPNASFPLGCVHEFLSACKEDAAATNGFISGLLGSLLGNAGIALWISSARTVFPPSLKRFGIEPDRFIFIDVQNERDVLWAMDEALKCGALTAVVGELNNLSFTESRRLQLATEQSKVTGFILRSNLKNIATTACVSRWKISPIASDTLDDLPGIGFPKWKVELLRIRNGRAGEWKINWIDGRFQLDYQTGFGLKVLPESPFTSDPSEHNQKKAG